VDKAHKELEKKRKKLTEAMKERKIMEKLREKKYQYFQDEVKTEEFNFADDIAGRKAFFGKDSLISGD
jgi:flagellar FliJ protein